MRVATVLLLALLSVSASAEVIVVPPAPTAADTVFVRVQNTFGSTGHVTSATMNRVGNTFVIQQNVEIVCTPVPPPPAPPIIGSDFQLPQLPPGLYGVTATINVTTCARTPFSQSRSFAVAAATTVPALDGRALFLMTLGLVAVALVALRGR